VGKTNYAGATGNNERAIDFSARAEAPEKKVNGRDEQGRVETARQAGSPVADAGQTRNDSIACQ
jgi:hypothetical protein